MEVLNTKNVSLNTQYEAEALFALIIASIQRGMKDIRGVMEVPFRSSLFLVLMSHFHLKYSTYSARFGFAG